MMDTAYRDKKVVGVFVKDFFVRPSSIDEKSYS
jgi:hypothetical protein